jgi:hypothetical protein
MSDLNTTLSTITKTMAEYNLSIHELSNKVLEHTHNTINTPPGFTEEDVINIVNKVILSSVDGVNSSIETFLTFAFGVATIYAVITGFNFFSVSKLKKELKEELNKHIGEEINEKNKNINKNIKKSILENQQIFQEDEYLRNLIFYDLSKTLATDINKLGEENLKKVFNLYSTRLLVATQLTSGSEKKIKIALKTISQPSYSIFLSLTSVRNYIKTLEFRDELNIEDQLLSIKKSINEENSIF